MSNKIYIYLEILLYHLIFLKYVSIKYIKNK